MKPVICALTSLAIAFGLPHCSAPSGGGSCDREMEPTHTMYRKLTCNLMVEDVNETIRFYRDVLEFAFVIGVPENSQAVVTEPDPAQPLAFAILQHGDVQIMFQSRASLMADLPIPPDQPVGGSVVLYIETTDAKALYEKLRGKVDVLRDLHDTFYGKREFYIQDCNGYILGFTGEPTPQDRRETKANA